MPPWYTPPDNLTGCGDFFLGLSTYSTSRTIAVKDLRVSIVYVCARLAVLL